MKLLVGVAAAGAACVTLIGCGGGDSVQTTPPPPPPPFSLVSQTFDCKDVKFSSSSTKHGVPSSGTYKLMIDATPGAIRWRSDMTIEFVIDTAGISEKFTFEAVSLYSEKDKKHIFSNHQITEVTGGGRELNKACISIDIVPKVADVKTCMDKVMAAFPISAQDNANLVRYEMQSRHNTQSNSTDGEYVSVDGAFVFKELAMFEIFQNKTPSEITVTKVADPDSKAGVPPADVFKVPEDWPACTIVDRNAFSFATTVKAAGVPFFMGACAGLQMQPVTEMSAAKLAKAKLEEVVA